MRTGKWAAGHPAVTDPVHSPLPPAPECRSRTPDGPRNRTKGLIVSSADRADAPIYHGLVEERGDVPADVRRTAEETLREVGRTLDFDLQGAGALR